MAQNLFTVLRLQHVVTLILQLSHQEEPHVGLVFGYEDVSGGANDVVVQTKATTKLAAGFTATVAGTTPNGILHWRAVLDA